MFALGVPVSSCPRKTADDKKILALFDEYKDTEDEIQDDGSVRFFGDLGVDTQDVVVLILSWKMQAEQMCIYTRDEFMKGCVALDCDTMEKLAQRVPQLRDEVKDERAFKDFYMFCFTFSKMKAARSLDLELATDMFRLLLQDRWSHLGLFTSFLEEKWKNAITKDQWALVLDFSTQIQDDLSNYSDEGKGARAPGRARSEYKHKKHATTGSPPLWSDHRRAGAVDPSGYLSSLCMAAKRLGGSGKRGSRRRPLKTAASTSLLTEFLPVTCLSHVMISFPMVR